MCGPVIFADLPLPATVEIVAADTTREIERIVRDAVTRRAYQLFEEGGRIAGRDEENWRQAESETLQNALNVRETGAWLSVDGELSGVSSPIVRITLAPRRVLVESDAQDLFFAADLPADIDPRTAIASLKDSRLKLMVKKCDTNLPRT